MFCVSLTPKVKGQITYFLVNASPKLLETFVATSNLTCALVR